MQPWKTLSRRTALSQPPWITVEHHEVQMPNGHVIPDWAWVITPDYVNVAAMYGRRPVPHLSPDQIRCAESTFSGRHVAGDGGAGIGHLWLAFGAHKVAEINADDLEEQELLLLTRDEAERARGIYADQSVSAREGSLRRTHRRSAGEIPRSASE